MYLIFGTRSNCIKESVYTDDGFTGTNFDRPGMQAMLEMVRDSKIDCIIVKDFSRFARDYIALGSYLEQIFPFMGVRFISVNDDYDSREYQGSLADIDVNFKNLLYDLYSRDLSQKVRSSLAVRKEKGQYVSGNSPFGYEKDPNDRHRLLVEEEEAEVVRRIFSLALEGYTSSRIARMFNETGVKTPMEFKVGRGKTRRAPKGGRFLWTGSTVCSILKNEVYIGNIVQKKTTKEFVGGKNRLNPSGDWLVSYHHHEPVIDKEIFEKVQEGRGIKGKKKTRHPHPLIGKLACGCCKRNLGYRKGEKPYFSCPYRYVNGMEACVGKVEAGRLEQHVLALVRDKAVAEGEWEKICRAPAEKLYGELEKLRQRQRALSVKAARLKRRKLEEYQDYALGEAGEFRFDNEKLEAAERELAVLNERARQVEKEYAQIAEGECITVLSKEIIERFIERILVHGELDIEIFWK